MLLVLRVEGLEKLYLKDMEAGKEVKVKGTVTCMYFDENYIAELEEKARKYEEHIENKEMIKKEYERLEKEAEPSRVKAKELKSKSLELINHLNEMISEAKKKDIRRIAKKGIPYKNKNYTFDGWENHIGEIISFEVLDDFLLLNLEGQALYATTQDI